MRNKDIDLINFKTYLARYLRYCGECDTYREAWEKTEEDYYKVFKRYRYSSFQSFAVVKGRYLRG